MKTNLCLFIVSCMVSTTVFAATESTKNADPTGFTGKYSCKNVDSHDGNFTGVVDITRDDRASDKTFNTYVAQGKATLSNGKTDTYHGNIIVQGTTAATSFVNPDDATDHGVGIGKMAHEKDSTGKIKTIYTATYFQPAYERDAKNPGGRGTWECVKQ